MKILVVIDAQNDFIAGSLRNEEAIKAVPKIVEKINSFDGDVIYVTQDTHTKDYLDTPEGKRLPFEHCINRTHGWMINDSIQAALTNADYNGIDVVYVEKPTFGSFDLVEYLEDDANEAEFEDDDLDIEFVGFCTDICVVSNVLMAKAALYDIATISVDSSCCAGVTPALHEAALNTMRSCQVNVH